MKREKIVIGRTVRVDFSGELEGFSAIAKVDTGAYSGALHVEDLREEDGFLYFKPLSKDNPEVRVGEYTHKLVRSASGHEAHRYLIKVPVVIAGVERVIQLGLAGRSTMRFEVLIGRKNLKGKFLVDVSKSA